MDQNLLIVLAVFVFISAIALCIQAGMLFAMYKATRSMEEKVVPLIPKIDALMDSSREAVEESRRQIHEISVRTADILDSTRNQLARVDEVLEDAAGRVRVQMDRAELVLDDAMNRTQETVVLVHRTIMKPLREIQGVTAGIRAALNYLSRGRRDGPVHATADEEMFI